VGRRLAAPVAVVVVVALWQLVVVRTGADPRFLPSPVRVAAQGWAQREAIGEHAAATLTVTLVGFAVSTAVAWLVAVVVDLVPPLRRAVVPLLVMSQALPVTAIAPLTILWFGFGLLPKVLVITLVTFFPVAIGLVEGFAAAGPRAEALLRSMGAGRWQRFRYVRLPAALPRFFTALRIGITYAVVGAIFAEYVGAQRGLGIYLSMQKNAFRTDLVLAAVVVAAALSLLLFAGTHLLERLLVPWARPATRRQVRERVR